MFSRLEGACEHTHDWNRYVAIHEEEEKGHRKFKPDFVNAGLTKGQSVKLFAVKQIFDTFIPNEGGTIFKPTAEDYLYVRRSCFAAWSIRSHCLAEIEKEFTKEEMIHFLDNVDYVELNKDPRQEVAA
jgi:hypothetical protein